MLRAVSRAVFSCFHRFEKAVDQATSRVGPVFVLLCAVLLGLGTITFCVSRKRFLFGLTDSRELDEVYFPAIFLGSGWSVSILGLVWSVYLVSNFSFHYYAAVTTLPGSPQDPPGTVRYRPFLSWSTTHTRRSLIGTNGGISERRQERIAATQGTDADTGSRVCKKCPLVPSPDSSETWDRPFKPERAHHCSVGLYNERYFLLFMIHLSLACASVAVLGIPTLLSTLNFRTPWPYYTPRTFTMLLWILGVAMAFALAIMAVWQLWLNANGETTVEANDNAYYRRLAKLKHRTFLNPYHLGYRKNLAEFFNVGPGGYPLWTVFLPVRVPPSSNGWTWAKRKDWQATRVEEWEELTDDEGGG